MIFALADYWMYWIRKGRYSHENLGAQRLYPATEKNFPDYKTYPLGTMLFTCTFDSFLSWTVMYSTNSTISHVALFYGDGMVNDCTTSGIIRHSFANYFDESTYVGIIFLPAGGVEERAFMDETLGDGYNWFGVVSTFFQILLGAHKDIPWRLWADFLPAIFLLWSATHWITPVVDYIYGSILLGFLVTITFNRFFKKRRT